MEIVYKINDVQGCYTQSKTIIHDKFINIDNNK